MFVYGNYSIISLVVVQQEVANRTRKSLDIHLDDVEEVSTQKLSCSKLSLAACHLIQHSLSKFLPSFLQYFAAKDPLFLKRLLENTKRYQSLLASQVDKMLDRSETNCILPKGATPEDTFDVLMKQVS